MLQIVSLALNACIYIFLVYFFLPFKMKSKELAGLVSIVFGNMALIAFTGNYAVIILLISLGVYVSLLDKNRVVNIISIIIGYLFCVVMDQSVTFFWNAKIVPIERLLEDTAYYNWYLVCCVLLLALTVPVVSKYYHILRRKIQMHLTRSLLALISSNVGICLVIFLFNIVVGEYVGYSPEIIGFNGVLFGIYFVISTIMIISITRANEKRMELEKRQEVYQNLQEYTTQIENMYASLRAFKHDYSNIMLTLSEYIETEDMRGLRIYFEERIVPLNEKLRKEHVSLNKLMHIRTPELKGIISAKLVCAIEKGIVVEIEATESVESVEMDIVDLARVTGIFLDNAIEAAMETEAPMLRFAVIRAEKETVFIVANTYVDRGISVAEMKEAGVSTKGDGRGIGLHTVQEIVAKYQNVYWDTECKKEFFVQTLHVTNVKS